MKCKDLLDDKVCNSIADEISGRLFVDKVIILSKLDEKYKHEKS